MLKVHHLNNSRSQRVLWLLEELGLEYEIEFYERDPRTMLAPKALRDVHPLGKSPVVTDGGRVLAESAAIIEYIVDEHGEGRLRPAAGSDDYFRYRYWMHYAEGSAMTPLLVKLICHQVRKKAPFLIRPIANKIADSVDSSYTDRSIALHMNYWEAELGKSEWFANDEFSAADIQMSFPLEAASARKASGSFPNVEAFVRRIHDRPAFQAALERGGPYKIG